MSEAFARIVCAAVGGVTGSVNKILELFDCVSLSGVFCVRQASTRADKLSVGSRENGENGENGMKIHGFQKTTLLDYPGHVAATVFTGGCNFRCPFCHNGSLVLHPEGQPVISEEEIFSYLKKRRGVLEGVCVTGGEPTLQKGLSEFLGRLKELGYLVKLDTNGSSPQILEELMKAGLLDYVAMDVKASWDHYETAVGIKGFDPSSVRESIGLLKVCNISYEFRTTVVKGIHTVAEFEEIGRMLEGCQAYYLQGFQESGDMVGEGCGAFSKEEMEKMADRARKYIDKVMLRGVE